jgi:hypothetical protein
LSFVKATTENGRIIVEGELEKIDIDIIISYTTPAFPAVLCPLS